jgi:hypothetical protein
MIAMATAAFNKKETLSTDKLDLKKNISMKLVKYYVWSIGLRGAEIRTVRKVDQN